MGVLAILLVAIISIARLCIHCKKQKIVKKININISGHPAARSEAECIGWSGKLNETILTSRDEKIVQCLCIQSLHCFEWARRVYKIDVNRL